MTSAALDEARSPIAGLLGPQQDFYWDDREYIVYRGGRGTGKTTAACTRIMGVIQRNEIPPGSRILVGGPTYPQLKKGTLLAFDDYFDPTGMITDKINGNEPERKLVNDITVYFRNMSNPDQTRGHQVVLVWLDEFAQMNANVIRLSAALLRQYPGRVKYQTILTGTPRGKDWSWRMFIAPNRKLKDDELGTYHLTTVQAERLGIARKGYVRGMGYTPGTPDYEREVMGNYAAWSGLVFSKFDAEKHCDPARFAQLPEFAAVYGGIDVGYGGYTAMHLTGLTRSGVMLTFKEYYRKSATPHEWMAAAAEWRKEYNVRRFYIDSAAAIEYRAMLAAGLPVYQSMKQSDAAGTAVGFINGRLQQMQLFIDLKKCPFLVSEIEAYQYKEQQSGDETTFLEKVKPNQQDHAIDDWRYHILPLSNVALRPQGVEERFVVGSFR